MDTCDRTRQVSAYHDGELPLEERRALEAHLAHCPVCIEELQQLRGISRFLAGARVPDAPAELLQRLHDTPRVRERVVIRMAEVLMAAAAVILVVCAAWTFAGFGLGAPRTTVAAPWEETALTLGDTSTSEPQEVAQAQWIVEDLSSEKGHD